MRFVRAVLAMSGIAMLSGCYHQAVQTGLAPSNTVVQKNFHPTWVFGLVKATPIDVRQECPNGVAAASTRMTFPNGLVGMLTLGIFTPHEVKVTCASSGSALLNGSHEQTLFTLDAFTGAAR